MRRLSGWMFAGVVCTAMAGCSPDLTVNAYYNGWTCSEDGYLRVNLEPQINNNGPGAAVLPEEWTKPWVTAYPSKPIPLFVQPYQTLGKSLTLQPGDSVTVPLSVNFPPVPGGGAFDIVVEVDPYKVITETDETNNTSSFTIPANFCG